MALKKNLIRSLRAYTKLRKKLSLYAYKLKLLTEIKIYLIFT